MQRRHSRARRANKTLRTAKNELLFQAMILVPHQIEVIFVLCTLLSGRRKLYVQDVLLELGLPQVLLRMFGRLSWECSTISTINPFEHVHGPNCECNPENALRIQFLRLVHNFYDRDFVNCSIKLTMLSEYERRCSLELGCNTSISEIFIPLQNRGLLTMLMGVLMKEPLDSIYRFWLSSCLEAFLRGNQLQEQLFVIRCGLMRFLVDTIMNNSRTPKTNMQTAYDLLAELVKFNAPGLYAFDSLFDAASWSKFTSLLSVNLVDSNVFIRSLYLTLSEIEAKSEMRLVTPAYCTNTWIQVLPVPMISRISMCGEEKDEVSSSQRSLQDCSNLARISQYLDDNKYIILLKLIRAVTVYAINHENICCVNSALIILLEERRR